MISIVVETYSGVPLPLMDYTLANAVASGTLSEKDKHVCILQISSALSHMHGKGSAHLDIEPENIFKNGNAFLLGDFGTVHHL